MDLKLVDQSFSAFVIVVVGLVAFGGIVTLILLAIFGAPSKSRFVEPSSDSEEFFDLTPSASAGTVIGTAAGVVAAEELIEEALAVHEVADARDAISAEVDPNPVAPRAKGKKG